MSKKIYIEKNKYSTTQQRSPNKNIANYYFVNYNNDSPTYTGDDDISIITNLPSDVNIFSDLPDYVYQNTNALEFLNVLKKKLKDFASENITFSKLRVSEHSETNLVLDWIYNYFRVYYSFDSNDGNYYGIVVNNTEVGSFTNKFALMQSNKYEEIANYILDFVVKMIKGENGN